MIPINRIVNADALYGRRLFLCNLEGPLHFVAIWKIVGYNRNKSSNNKKHSGMNRMTPECSDT